MMRTSHVALSCAQHHARRAISSYRSIDTARQPAQSAIKAAYYRGGTSRAVILQPRHLPSNRTWWPSLFRQLMGSGGAYGRQLDGMGAGLSSLSKICLVEPHRKTRSSEDAAASQSQPDIDYTFVGLGIENDEVDVAGNCGNMSSAIGPYAYNSGLLPRSFYGGNKLPTVKIRNTNTQKILESTFKVVGGQAAVAGDYAIDGVKGTGSRIQLDFLEPYGSKTGKVLPTGRTIDAIHGYKATCVDGPNPAIFVRADELGINGAILPNEFNKCTGKLELLEKIRKSAAVKMGIAATEEHVPRTIPKIGIVSQSSTHPLLSGKTLESGQMDLVVRFISDTQPHRAIPLTAALTTAIAAKIQGTIVEQLLTPDPIVQDAITIGHASGTLQVNATMSSDDPVVPTIATVYRTAKRLMEGDIYWVDDKDQQARKHPEIQDPIYNLGEAFVLEQRGLDSKHLLDQVEREVEWDAEPLGPGKLSYKPFRYNSEERASDSAVQDDAIRRDANEVVHSHAFPGFYGRISKSNAQETNESNHPLTSKKLYSRIPDSTAEDSDASVHAPNFQGAHEWRKWARTMHNKGGPLRYKAKKIGGQRKQSPAAKRLRLRKDGKLLKELKPPN